jgi:hypothetical protein
LAEVDNLVAECKGIESMIMRLEENRGSLIETLGGPGMVRVNAHLVVGLSSVPHHRHKQGEMAMIPIEVEAHVQYFYEIRRWPISSRGITERI